MNVLIYRCRRCGSEEEFPIEPDRKLFLQEIINGYGDYQLYEVHSCPMGGFGISDLIGARSSDSSEGSK